MNLTARYPSDRGHSAHRFLAVGLCLATCTLGALAQSPPNKTLIADVIAQGNHNVPTAKIMSMIKIRPGMPFDRDQVAQDVQKLYESHSFANVRVVEQPTADGRMIVFFQFAELPNTVQE